MNGATSSNTIPSGVQGICPSVWHLPSRNEWFTLQNYLVSHGYTFDGNTTDNKIAKSMAASILWASSSNLCATGNNLKTNNSTCFSAVPGGIRFSLGYSDGLVTVSQFWSSSAFDAQACNFFLEHYRIEFDNGSTFKSNGFSIRCIRDN
jgi:uncharacterized protein (TIGR02145 family)